jgi:hypothetical protein
VIVVCADATLPSMSANICSRFSIGWSVGAGQVQR